jgi:YegS/Rv2252/BmrU family lipid kinase
MTAVTRPALVVNPTKAPDLCALRRRINQRLERANIGEPLWLETTATDPGTGQTQAALAQGADVVMAYGGDGTQRACAASLAGSGVPLAVLPAGTGNLLARNLGIPVHLEQALEVPLRGGRKQIDLCQAGADSFVVMAGMGFDARMLADTSRALKERIGWLAYGLAGLHAVPGAPTLQIQLEMDEGRTVTRPGVGVLVANLGGLTGGMTLLEHAAEDDGLLTVAVLTPERLRDWAWLAARMVARRAPARRTLPVWQTSSLRVTVDRAAPVEVDGEVLAARAEQDFWVSAGALTVCVPDREDRWTWRPKSPPSRRGSP